mmetsp:Transcript_23387/g.67392  ORF Transcript_23387/g.67392 Transcript_23387/m.67392 type:complete len:225 (-) Transcript_23387:95-769(-)|eukprot:CAMPEP_0181057168 /NCGR_PEP_ID=MMETSP1070-20121207/20103_1 /TAXON_ID=265543 /ORGANISM="Minutocellus polymorphus, Strain NH13" /LENGTH=224 /DNA_ID=CAMNT_0023136557 /DNA_START=165 /DNA_END=839 /DNA_ORIENTATION=+
MSRAFSPPDTLSKDDIRTLGDVRRNIWTAGFTGLAYGSVTGFASHSIIKYVYNKLPEKQKLKMAAPNDVPFRFTRNTAFLSVMVGGAVGSFVMATAAGKNRVHKLAPIYEAGKKEGVVSSAGGMSDYQRDLQRAQEREEEIRERNRRRLSRRKTMRQRLEEGHGLSDSHSGNWADDNNTSQSETWERNRRRMSRRATVRHRLEEGHGLSDSHGGHWSASDGDAR